MNSEIGRAGTTGHPSGALPPKGAAAGLMRPEDWRELFRPFSHIVLVANSEANDVAALQGRFPDTALFVFFNRAYKTLEDAFTGRALLVSRGQPRGANIIYRDEVDEVLRLFSRSDFLGIMNIRLSLTEKLNTAAEFNNAPTGHLDLVGFSDDFYTEGKTPTSGFALALWLAEQRLPGAIVLAGFTARRTEKWKVVSVHDWSFEQTFLRLLARFGKITIEGSVAGNAYLTLAQRFPEISPSDIALEAASVLSERLGNTDAEIDKLISLTAFVRETRAFIRRVKWKYLKRSSTEA